MEKFKNFKFALLALLMMASTAVMAQVTVTGTVYDDMDEPVLGATVREVGGDATNGVITDLDGNFSIKVSSPNATLSVTYIGFQEQEVNLNGRTSVEIRLAQDALMLDEMVVVGYGVQKKKLVTGATVEVKGDAIQKLNTTQVLGALQSQTPGVNITAASGQPGDGFKVAIRGAGTNSDTKPIYVIDGVAGGDINNLNPADIERIDVLKDAASAAIYGSNGANGVILITTKQGKEGKISVTYDGNIGWQNVYRMPQLLTANEYMQIQDVVNFNSSGQTYDWSKYVSDPDLLAAYQNGSNEGTNWLDLMRNKNAVTTSHALNIAGGTDRSKFSFGLGYQYQDGGFGNIAKSDYRRFTLRLNSEHVIYRSPSGLDVVKVGENVYWSHKQNQGIQIGNQYSNVISTALRANPLVPAYGSMVDGKYVNDGSWFGYDDISALGMFGFNSYTSNPAYALVTSQSANNKSQNYGLNAVGYLEIQPIKGLVYRGQVNYSQSSWSWRCYLPTYHLNDQGEARDTEQITQQLGLGWSWGTTHTIDYKFDVVRDHHFDVMLGLEYGESRPDFGQSLQATTYGSTIFQSMYQAYVGLTPANVKGSAVVDGYPYGDSRSMSYFGRINYDYNETYMLSVILRADGSSNFAPGHRWGYFPSVSAGWVVTNEKFMQGASSWLDFLKLRVGWGQNGNKNIGDSFAYLATFAYSDFANYPFNSDKNSYTSGAAPTRLANEDLTWETSEQTDIGLDFRFLGGRLGFTADWYYKKTKDLLLAVPTYATTGFSTYWKNAGTVRNTGVELAIDWHDRAGKDFDYSIAWNMAYNSNKVTEINGAEFIDGGNDLLAQSTGTMARMEAGHPIGYFYGYKTEGVIQNEQDKQDYLNKYFGGDASKTAQGSDIGPGDLKFVDVNSDGQITSDDKTEIGSPHPKVTMGINIGLAWKGFDINITGYGAFGQDVARSYRKFTDGQYENYTTEVYSYWNGEGTSNRYPKLQPGNRGVNWQYISDIYVENASYFRLQNLTIGYDFKRLLPHCPFEQLRFYVAAQNLFTITGYKGMDPECGTALNSDEPWVTGVDVGNYPQARTYMIGVNIKF